MIKINEEVFLAKFPSDYRSIIEDALRASEVVTKVDQDRFVMDVEHRLRSMGCVYHISRIINAFHRTGIQSKEDVLRHTNEDYEKIRCIGHGSLGWIEKLKEDYHGDI